MELLKKWYEVWKYGIDMKNVSPDPAFPDKGYYPFFYKTRRVEQNSHVFEFLNKLSRETSPSLILELGFRNAGFTLLLQDHKLSKKATIEAFDIEFPEEDFEDFDKNKVQFRYADIFQKIDSIKDLIHFCKGQVLVFCDGGDKNREFQLLASALKEGDVIMTHDYAPNEGLFQRDYLGKRWDWFESWDGELSNTIKTEGLKPFCTEEANLAVWSCYIK